MNNFLLTLFCSFLALTANAQTARKYSNDFLTIGAGSRAFAMSGAVAASSNDIYSSFWNPASLTNMTGNIQLGLMHSEYFAGIAKYDFGGLAAPIDAQSNAAFSIIRFAVDDIPNTTELIDAGGNINYDRVTSFSAADYAFLFSYARKTKNEQLRVGSNLKVVHRKVGEFGKAWGFGIDAAAQFHYNKFTFAAVAKDVTSTFNAWSYTLTDEIRDVYTRTENVIPENSLELTLPKLIIGTAYATRLSPKFGVTGEVDVDMTFDGPRNVLISYTSSPVSFDPHVGLELDYKKIVYLRGGIGNIQEVIDLEGKKTLTIQPNIGVGLKIKNLYLDYALTDVGNTSDVLYSNVFSLRLDIFRREG